MYVLVGEILEWLRLGNGSLIPNPLQSNQYVIFIMRIIFDYSVFLLYNIFIFNQKGM